MLRRVFSVMLWMVVAGYVPAQTDTVPVTVKPHALGADDLVFLPDSARLKMVRTGRISRNLEELPLTVYIVSHEEIIRNQYTSLMDVLSSLPAVKTSQPGSGELGESFQIRGLTGNLYTKILINGIPIKPSVVSGMPVGNQLPVRQAEKIEVIYGTASAMYGADAVEGVINIITREADKGTMVGGDISLGPDGYNYINFFLGGKGGKNNNILKYSFYGSKYEYNDMNIQYRLENVYNPLNYYQQRKQTFLIGGEEYEPLEITETLLSENGVDPEEFKKVWYGPQYEGSINRPDMESLSAASHMIGVQMEFRGVRLSYDNMYRRTHSSIGLSPVFYKYNNPQNYWGESIQRTTLSYTKAFDYFSTHTLLSGLVYRMDNNSSQGVTFLENTDKVYRYSASNDFLFEQTFTVVPVTNLELVAGLSYQKSGNLPVTNYLMSPFDRSDYSSFSTRVVSRDTLLGSFGLNPISYSNLSGFLQYYFVLNRFRFLGGLRYDKNSLYGNRFSPQMAVLYKTGGHASFRLSAGTAYKSPPSSIAFQSLAFPVASDQIHYKVVPNRHLEPEKFNTLELGIHTRLLKKLELHQTFYYYSISNHIIPEKRPASQFTLPRAANDSVFIWMNSRESLSNVYGSQTTIRYKNIVPSIRMDGEISLSLLERRDRLPQVEEIVEEYFRLMPRHEGKLKLSFYPAKNLYVNVESQWMSKWLRLLIPFEGLYSRLFKDVDGYYAMNVMASYNLSPELRAFIRVTNLFDEAYGGVNATLLEENLVYNPQIRRSIRIGLSYNLN
ncbi:MAG TPA: hypothetical protein ENN63_08905 [Bacteroidetes bacterium]|nr:hypothetical protein [Bacteroidota bacterium]